MRGCVRCNLLPLFSQGKFSKLKRDRSYSACSRCIITTQKQTENVHRYKFSLQALCIVSWSSSLSFMLLPLNWILVHFKQKHEEGLLPVFSGHFCHVITAGHNFIAVWCVTNAYAKRWEMLQLQFNLKDHLWARWRTNYQQPFKESFYIEAT